MEEKVKVESPYLTAVEAADYLKISYSTFRKKAKFIKKMPGTGRYRKDDLDAFAQHPPKRVKK